MTRFTIIMAVVAFCIFLAASGIYAIVTLLKAGRWETLLWLLGPSFALTVSFGLGWLFKLSQDIIERKTK